MSAQAPDYGTPDTFSYPPGTSLLNFQRNAGFAVAESGLDLEDSATVSWSLVDDPANSRVKVSATATVAYPVTSVFGRAGAVVAAAGDYTAAQVTSAADKSAAATQIFTGAVFAGSNPALPTLLTGSGLSTLGTLRSVVAGVGNIALQVGVANNVDTTDRFRMFGDGTHLWGPGNAGTDTTLERSAANTLRLTNTGLLSTSPTVGLGYGAGSGGSINQATSKSTAVTLHRVNGVVNMNAAALAAGASVSFTIINNTFVGGDLVVINPQGATGVNYRAEVVGSNGIGGAGQFVVRVTNVSAGSLSESIALQFGIYRSVTA